MSPCPHELINQCLLLNNNRFEIFHFISQLIPHCVYHELKVFEPLHHEGHHLVTLLRTLSCTHSPLLAYFRTLINQVNEFLLRELVLDIFPHSSLTRLLLAGHPRLDLGQTSDSILLVLDLVNQVIVGTSLHQSLIR